MMHLLVLFALFLLGCGEATTCESCAIDLGEVVTLENVGYAMSTRVVRTSDGSFAVVGTYDPERIVMFDKSGAAIRATGRKGRGPGEFERLTRVAVGNGDTLFLVDGARIHILDSNLNWLSTVSAPMPPADLEILPDGAVFGHAATYRSRGLPLLYKFDPDSALQVSWFDYHKSEVPFSALRMISFHDSELWSVGA